VPGPSEQRGHQGSRRTAADNSNLEIGHGAEVGGTATIA
jgi:hypothetical protein